MQGWFRMPQDSGAGRWWSLTMPMTDAKMLELNSLRMLRVNRILMPSEVGTVQWDPWVGEGGTCGVKGRNNPLRVAQCEGVVGIEGAER
eukprot:3404756-Prymnesium_polylepis.1